MHDCYCIVGLRAGLNLLLTYIYLYMLYLNSSFSVTSFKCAAHFCSMYAKCKLVLVVANGCQSFHVAFVDCLDVTVFTVNVITCSY